MSKSIIAKAKVGAYTAVTAQGLINIDDLTLREEDLIVSSKVVDAAAVPAVAQQAVLTVAALPGVGLPVTVTFVHSASDKQQRRDVYKVYQQAGDTTTTIAAKLAAKMNADSSPVIVSATPAAAVVTVVFEEDALVQVTVDAVTVTNAPVGPTVGIGTIEHMVSLGIDPTVAAAVDAVGTLTTRFMVNFDGAIKPMGANVDGTEHTVYLFSTASTVGL